MIGHKNANFTIRKANRSDSEQLINLIIGLAEFERLKPPDKRARARLALDIFEKERVKVFVASEKGKLAGYALYFYTYSSFLARPTLYLEDIFVQEESRRGGIGKALFVRCVREATKQCCGRMEWQVLTWNRKAMGFYESVGAKMLDDYRLFRLDEKELHDLSNVT